MMGMFLVRILVMEIMILAVCRDVGLGGVDMYVQDVLQSNSMNSTRLSRTGFKTQCEAISLNHHWLAPWWWWWWWWWWYLHHLADDHVGLPGAALHPSGGGEEPEKATKSRNWGETNIKKTRENNNMCLQVADLRLKLATVQSKNIVLSNREIRLLRYVDVEQDDEEHFDLEND